MKVYTKTIEYDKDGELFKIIAYSDVHLGAAACEKERFHDMCKRHGRDKNTYFIDIGDGCDCIIAKDQKRFRPSSVDPDLMTGLVPQEDWIDTEVDWYCEPLEKHIDLTRHLGLISGNHHDAILKYHSTDPTKRIAKRLGIKNLGYNCSYQLIFKHPDGSTQRVVLYAHHGWGGGSRTDGGDVTKYCRHARNQLGSDICLYGHSHKKWVFPIVRVYPNGNRLKEQRVLVFNTGSFLKTHGPSVEPTYSEQAGYNPTDLGYVIIHIRVFRNCFDLRGVV